MTPAMLELALKAGTLGTLTLLVEDCGSEIFEAPVASAREDSGWLYLSAQPMVADGGVIELSPVATATLIGDDGRRLSAPVDIGAASIPPGSALLVVVAIALQLGDDLMQGAIDNRRRAIDSLPAKGAATIASKEIA